MSCVSVIVPIYNKEKYLDRCIESISKQTYANLEIILINDGSTDSSDKICRHWAASDTRIRYISQDNAGVSKTRNIGIEMATGEAISFVDADDYLVDNAIETAVREIQNGADVCYFGRYLLSGEAFLNHYIKIDAAEEYVSDAIKSEFITTFIGGIPGKNERNYVSGNVCTAMYRIGVLKENNVRFGRITQNEDSIFNLELNRYTNKVVVIPDILYVYNINVGSSSRRYVGDRFEQYKEWYYTCMSYSESYKQCSDFVLRTQYRLWQSVNLCLRLESLHKKENGKKHEYAAIKKVCTDEEVARIARVMCKMEKGKVKRVFAELVKLGSPLLIDMYFGTWQVVNKMKSNKKYNTEMKNPISA